MEIEKQSESTLKITTPHVEFINKEVIEKKRERALQQVAECDEMLSKFK